LSFRGKRMRNLRQAVSRSHNFGVTTEVLYQRDLDGRSALRDKLLAIGEAQRKGAPEYGFSMTLGSLLTGPHPDCVVIYACDRDGEPVGFQRYVPCRRGRTLSLDVMRRTPDAPNGVNERMIVDVIEWGKPQGLEEVSLNFAAFRAVLDDDARGPGARTAATAWVLRRFEGRLGIQVDTLRRFNAKFDPRWVPRHLVYRSTADIGAVGIAALSAEGFLPFDRTREP
jgi:lysyl-tRNA synthetase class 2